MDALAQCISGIESALLIAGSAEAIARRCSELGSLLQAISDPWLASSTLERLAPLLSRRAGAVSEVLADFIAAEAERLPHPGGVLARMVDAVDDAARERAVYLAARLARRGRFTLDARLLDALARADDQRPFSAEALRSLKDLVLRAPAAELPRLREGDRLEALLLDAADRRTRRWAARLLDARGDSPAPDLVRELLGEEAAAFLLPYLEHSRATYQDLVALVPPPGRPPAVLQGLRDAERALGTALLREVVGRLGWARMSCGLSAQAQVGLSIDGSFPFVVSPEHAALVSGIVGGEPLWRRALVIAHGGPADDEQAPARDDAVTRFRGYNLVHAELLQEILAVAPLDREKVERVLRLMDRVVADFAALFAAMSDDARRVGELYERLRRDVLEDLAGTVPGGPLPAEVVRRVQMFEDPQRLDDVTTVHGLKRYLHQQGLRLAFQLFRAQGEANRTVDLLVTGEREVLRCEQVIRYLEFEPAQGAGPAGLPFVVGLIARALGRQLLHGRKLPWVTVLGYGNELQVFVSYRNHPAFVRIDLSPPLRGGMVDLSYFAVSQYELDQHPDLSLPAIQHLLRTLDFDVAKDGLRLHARYDKERARDLGDVVAKARSLFDLLPHLMEVDWIVADLEYPAAARAEVTEAWSRFFAAWGVLPAPEVLTSNRRRILLGIERDVTGPREVPWDGRGPYRDRLAGKPAPEVAERLRAELDRRGLGAGAAGAPAVVAGWGQRHLDETVLGPLDEAVERGEARRAEAGLALAPADVFAREHEAERLADVLQGGGRCLARAVRMAALVRSIERQARFQTTGSIQGHAVQAATLPTSPRIGLFVLRDAQGIVQAALACSGGVLSRSRPAPDAPWDRRDELDELELTRRLRAYNYVGDAPLPMTHPGPEELDALRHRFAAPSATPVSRRSPGERVAPAVAAAPGWATGFARFHGRSGQPADFGGAILVSRAIRPEDAPWLRYAAAIASTGGGTLSHLGLIAVELQKPAVILDGRWSAGPSGAEVLVYRRPQWREVESTRGAYHVVCRHELRDAEELLEEGDLVAVDGDEGAFVVLGHDGQALALHHDLHQLEAASRALARAPSEAEALQCRGRLLRARHQLQRLLSRIDRATLARHAVRELLGMARDPLSREGRSSRTDLLATLLRNPRCAEEARHAAVQRVGDLRGRYEAVRNAALEDIPQLASPSEVIFARLGAWRLHEALADTWELVGAAPGAARGADGQPSWSPLADVDEACRVRLGHLERELARRVDGALATPGASWEVRHLWPRLALAKQAFGRAVNEGPEPDDLPQAREERARSARVGELETADQVRVRALAPRCVIGMEDGGLELQPLVGGKGAHLGEVARVLGPALVPPWFTVAHAAFREALSAPVPRTALDALSLGPAATLEEAIAQVTGHADWPPRRQAELVRDLWRAVELPPALVAEISAAYARLAEGPDEDAPVAIRSSTREEDATGASWAGQFDTFLFVRGAASAVEHVRLAWAGFWSERAIDQRRVLGTAATPHGGGVVVQRMVDSRVSGVLQTVSAATGQLREMVVNVGLGLGVGIVSGTVEVDHVVVAKQGAPGAGGLQLRYRVGDKREQVVRDVERGAGTLRQPTRYHQRLRPALEYVELEQLVRAAARLEEAFAEPIDLEFGIEGPRLFILQVRPIPLFEAAWRETLSRIPLAREPTARREPP